MMMNRSWYLAYLVFGSLMLVVHQASSQGTPACKFDPTGVNYRGNVSQTLSGRTCQQWTSQHPHNHRRTLSEYPNTGLGAHNYCRNPDNVFTAWCYTTDPEVRWEYCAVGDFDPECSITPLAGGLSECYLLSNATDYRGNISVSRNGHTCQQWSVQTPHEHNYAPSDYPNNGLGDHNLCRNPGGSGDMVWCYTTSPTRWDFCNIGVPRENCNEETTTAETTSVTTHPTPGTASSISFSSDDPLFPCVYLGVPYLHSEVWHVDDCTTCTCDNRTTTCVIESCQPAFCAEPLKLPGGCCFICPYDVTVLNVTPTIQTKHNVTTNGDATLVLAAEVKFRDTRKKTGVRGESLWELSAWIAPVNTTHSHTRIGFTEQVLNVDQASQRYIKGNQFIFLDVVYTFVAPSFNCDEANVCVELKRGRNAVTNDGRPFKLSSDPDSSTPFIGCTSLCNGRHIYPCVDTGGIHLHADVWQGDPCTQCTCNNGTAACTTKAKCPDPGCNRPVRLEGECCLSCPYHVRVRRVSPFVMARGDQFHLRVLITFHESQHTTNVTGINLWKLSAWVALDKTKTGKRYDYREQILDDMQRSQQYVKGEIPAFAVDFGSADPAVVCGSAFYICVRFDMDSDYQTEHDRGFELSGLPDNSSLIGCTSTTISEEKCSTVDKADESPVKSDVWITLVISTIVLVGVVIIVLAVVYLRRRKKFGTPTDCDAHQMILTE